MARLEWTEPALQELDRIADYISLDNATAAKTLVKKIFARVEQLHSQPKMGKKIPEIEDSIYRELVVSPCRIFYRLEDETIFIIHIIRSEQLLRLELLKSR